MHIPTFLKCFRHHDKNTRSEALNDSRCIHRLSWKRWKKKKKENEKQVFDRPYLEYLTDAEDQSENTISDFTELFSEPEQTRSHDTLRNTIIPLQSILRAPPPPSTDAEIEDPIIRSGKRPLWPVFSRPLPSRRPLPGTGGENIHNAVEEVDESIDAPKATASALPATFKSGSCSSACPHSKEEPLITDSKSEINPSGAGGEASDPSDPMETGSSSRDASVVRSTTISTANAAFPATGKNISTEADFEFVGAVSTVTCSASSCVTSRASASTEVQFNEKDFNPSQSTLSQNTTAEVSSLGYESKTSDREDDAESGVVKSSTAYLEKGERKQEETATSSETSRPSVPTHCAHDTKECVPSQSSLKKNLAAEDLSLNLEIPNPESDDYVGLTVDTTSKTYMGNEETDAEEYTVEDTDFQESALENKTESKPPGTESAHSAKRSAESAFAAKDEVVIAWSDNVSEKELVLPNSQPSAVICDAEIFIADDQDVSEIQPVLNSCELLDITASGTAFQREGEDSEIVLEDDTIIRDDNNGEKNTEAAEKDVTAIDKDTEDVGKIAETTVQTSIPHKHKKQVAFIFAFPDPPPLRGFTLNDEDGVQYTMPKMMFKEKYSFKETAFAMRGKRLHERCKRKAVKASHNFKRFFNSRRFKCVVRGVGLPLLQLMVGVLFLVVLL